MTLPPVALSPFRCRDLTPWLKECRRCGHMKALSEFPLQGNPRAHSFGGTHSRCSECLAEQFADRRGRPWRKSA